MAIDSRDELGNQLLEDDETRITHLPKSAREVYQLLKANGALKPQEIGNHTTLSNRTIRYALKILIEDALVRRVPDLRDLRSHFYALN
jgi:DNA-binding MarR family transcriptional regulator